MIFRSWIPCALSALTISACAPADAPLGADAGADVPVTTPSMEPEAGFYDRLDHAVALAAQARALRAGSDGPLHERLATEVRGLVDSAESYGEAVLLARVVAGALDGQPAVPAVLSDDPLDPDWVFDGHAIEHAEAVDEALQARLFRRDVRLDALSDDEFDDFAAVEMARHRVRRMAVAEALGRPFDDRPDRYVVYTDDGQIWRRKGEIDDLDSLRLEGGEPGMAMAHALVGAVEGEPGLAEGDPTAEKILGDNDSRKLRSRYNGYLMGSSVWQPKGAIINADCPSDNASSCNSNAPKVQVQCSGTKISRLLVATAGHCIKSGGTLHPTKRFLPGADGIAASLQGKDPSPFGSLPSVARVVRQEWADHEWANHDFGLFVLADNLAQCMTAWHGWSYDPYLTQDTVHLYGYPLPDEQCKASPRTDGKCFGSIYGDGGKVETQGSYRIRYGIDTQDGQSGSGVYKIINGKRYVVGVHRGDWVSKNFAIWFNKGNAGLIENTRDDFAPVRCPD